MKQEFKLIHKWWFWVICGFVVLVTVSAIFDDCEVCEKCKSCDDCEVCEKCKSCDDCEVCERDLNECKYLGLQMVDNWNNYVDAFEDYCDIDYTNPLCATIPQR